MKLTDEQRAQTDLDGLNVHIVSELDDLPLRPVGEWAYDKVYRLVQYVGIFAGGMKNAWGALNRGYQLDARVTIIISIIVDIWLHASNAIALIIWGLTS